MLKELFASGARVKILELLLLNPQERFYQREMAERLKLAVGSVQQEMPRLIRAGIVTREVDGNRVYYSAESRCPIFPELKHIFLKASRIGELLRAHLARHADSIKAAFIYGSYAKGEEEPGSDIDLFVVGEIRARALSEIVSAAERDLGREVNPRLYAPAEFRKKVAGKDHFVTSVLAEPKVFVVGDADGAWIACGVAAGSRRGPRRRTRSPGFSSPPSTT